MRRTAGRKLQDSPSSARERSFDPLSVPQQENSSWNPEEGPGCSAGAASERRLHHSGLKHRFITAADRGPREPRRQHQRGDRYVQTLQVRRRLFTCGPFLCLRSRVDAAAWRALISPHLVTQLFRRQEKCSVAFDLRSAGSFRSVCRLFKSRRHGDEGEPPGWSAS